MRGTGKFKKTSEKSAGGSNATFNLSSSLHSSDGIRKVSSSGGIFGQPRSKKELHVGGMPPQTRSSRVNHLGNILDIKVPTN